MNPLTRAVRVLLIGDPPAADKVEHELKQIAGVELRYLRNPKSHHALVDQVHPGIDYVLAMNTRNSGSMLRELCRKHGAKMLPIPPSWSKTRLLLEEEGFFSKLPSSGLLQEPLTFKPFESVKEAAKVTTNVPVPSKPVPTPKPVPRQQFLVPAPPPQPKPAVQVPMTVAPKPVPAPQPVQQPVVPPVAPPAPPASHLTKEAKAKGAAVNSGRSADRMAVAERLFREGPDLSPEEVNKQIAMTCGLGLNGSQLYDVRRRIRFELGLPPAPGTKKGNRIEQPTESAPVVSPPPKVVQQAVAPVKVPEAPALSEGVLKAQKQLAEEVRKMGSSLQQYSFILVGGEIEVTHEMAVVQVIKKSSSL